MVDLILLFVVMSGCVSEETEFIWRIENFGMSPNFYSEEPFRSPWFSAGNPRHSVWYLELYRNVTLSYNHTFMYKLQRMKGSQSGDVICEAMAASFQSKTKNDHWITQQEQLFIHKDAMPQDYSNLRCWLHFEDVLLPYNSDFAELSQNFIGLYESKNFSDITLYTNDKEFFLHKFLLRKRAHKLYEDLERQCTTRGQGRVKVEEMSTPVLQTLLQYIYSGTLNAVSEENLPELYEVLEKYQFEEFMNEIMYLKSPATITTQIKMVRRNIYWNIEVKNAISDKNYLYRYVHFDFARFVVNISSTTVGHETYIHIWFRCVSSLEKDIVMSSIVSTWMGGVKLFSYPEERLRFSSKNGDKRENLQKLLCSKQISKRKSLLLQLNLAISNGEHTSSVDSLTLSFPEPPSVLGTSILSHHLNEIFSGIDNDNGNIGLSIGKDNGDVELHFGGSTLRAHKAVLATWSPVFSNILHQAMEDNNRDVVEISDIDINTARRMLKFMYSVNITIGKYADDVKLYVAADEYQITSLFRKCSKFLVIHLTLDNACDVLELADDHIDYSLLATVQRFIVSNLNVVLSSKKWFSLVATNPGLVSRVLKDISKTLSTRKSANSFNSNSYKLENSQLDNFYNWMLGTFNFSLKFLF